MVFKRINSPLFLTAIFYPHHLPKVYYRQPESRPLADFTVRGRAGSQMAGSENLLHSIRSFFPSGQKDRRDVKEGRALGALSNAHVEKCSGTLHFVLYSFSPGGLT
jgi:hypothetical protein